MNDRSVPDSEGLARPTSRRDFLKIGGSLIAGASILGIAGCSKDSGGGAGGTTQLTLGMTEDLFPALKKPIKQWAGGNKTQVTIRQMPSDTGTYRDQMRTNLQAGSTDIDVFAGDVSWPAQFAGNGWLADITDRFTDPQRAGYLANAVASNVYQGKVYGVPFFWDVGLLYYRKDLLEKAGFSAPPETWAELQDMATKVMRDQGIENGFVFTGANYEGGTLLGLEFIETSGGTVIDGDTVAANSPQAVDGLKTQRSMVAQGISPQAVANYQEGDAESPFVSGRAVFHRNWAYVFGELRNKDVSSIHPSQVGVTGIPRASATIPPVNVGGGWNLYVNAASQNQDAAFKLIQFISSQTQQKRTAATIGYLPTRSALYADPELIKTQPAIAQAKTEIEQTATPPKSPFYADMSALMSAQFNASLRGAVEPAQAADNIQKGLESIIQRGG